MVLDDGTIGTAAVPSGASTGEHEALELRDHDQKRFGGKGVQKAVARVNGAIAAAVKGLSADDQQKIDQTMIALDGTPGKSNLGANAILGVSLACARAAAESVHLPLYQYLRQNLFTWVSGWNLPRPMFNVLNGGVHAGWAMDIQEYMLVPQQAECAEQIRCGVEVFHALGQMLAKRKLPVTVGDEGGYAPKLAGNEAVIKLLVAAVERAGYQSGRDVRYSLDVAASQLYARGKYHWKADRFSGTAAKVIERYRELIARYPMVSIEDGLAENDWDGWTQMTAVLGSSTLLVGDDLFVTQAARVKLGVERKAGNAVLIKLNQVGTLSETVQTMALTRQYGLATIVSHRSGETTDDFIADLAVAGGAQYLKAGSLSRGERIAKWNRLMEIAAEVTDKK